MCFKSVTFANTSQPQKKNKKTCRRFISSNIVYKPPKIVQQSPKITIKIHDVIAEDAVAMVKTGRVELALSFDPDESDDLQFESLLSII